MTPHTMTLVEVLRPKVRGNTDFHSIISTLSVADQTRPGYIVGMKVANITEAKANLSRLVEYVRAGQTVVIAKAGKPVARLVALESEPVDRTLGGSWEGRVSIADDFDVLPADLEEAFGISS